MSSSALFASEKSYLALGFAKAAAPLGRRITVEPLDDERSQVTEPLLGRRTADPGSLCAIFTATQPHHDSCVATAGSLTHGAAGVRVQPLKDVEVPSE